MRGMLLLILGLALVPACRPADTAGDDPTAAIQNMLTSSAAAWNRGDLTAFMDDYERDSLTSYVSGRGVVYGWQTLYDRYHANYFAAGKSRDSVTFEHVRARPLAPGVALATARFALHRGDSVIASGPFTLLLRRADGRWRIAHDHTSLDPAR